MKEMKPKRPSESIFIALDRKYPIVERLQHTPSGWVGRDRLFSKDAIDHADYVDLSGDHIDENDHKQWAVIHLAHAVAENDRFWTESLHAMWDRYGVQILAIIRGGRLTPKQRKVMELVLEGHRMVEIQILMGFKNRSDVTRHFKRAAKRIFHFLKKIVQPIELDEAA